MPSIAEPIRQYPTKMIYELPCPTTNINNKLQSSHYEHHILQQNILQDRKNNEMNNGRREMVKEDEVIINAKKVYKWDIVWGNVILIGALHLLAVYGFYLRLTTSERSTLTEVTVKTLGILSSLGITAGAHRLWTHRCYKANWQLQCLLMFMATMTYQNSIYIWARDHRLHHKCSETDADPHNAKRGFFFSHVGWLLVRKHPDVIEQGKTVDMSDLEANPIVMFQHKYYIPLVIFGSMIIPGVATYMIGDLTWQQAFICCIVYKYVVSVNFTWCINSVAHLYGKKPYNKDIGPTESTLMKYFALGEGFHNYHHTFPWDYKAAEFGADTRNMTTYFIEFFAWLGWATDLQAAKPETINKRCLRTGGSGRELHMLKDKPNRKWHNLINFLIVAVYLIYL